MKTICIMCPLGCALNVEERDGEVFVSCNTCKKGETYGKDELLHPKRMVTTLIRCLDGKYVPVKTSQPIPKEKIFNVLREIKKTVIGSNPKIGSITIENILNLSVDILVTRED